MKKPEVKNWKLYSNSKWIAKGEKMKDKIYDVSKGELEALEKSIEHWKENLNNLRIYYNCIFKFDKNSYIINFYSTTDIKIGANACDCCKYRNNIENSSCCLISKYLGHAGWGCSGCENSPWQKLFIYLLDKEKTDNLKYVNYKLINLVQEQVNFLQEVYIHSLILYNNSKQPKTEKIEKPIIIKCGDYIKITNIITDCYNNANIGDICRIDNLFPKDTISYATIDTISYATIVKGNNIAHCINLENYGYTLLDKEKTENELYQPEVKIGDYIKILKRIDGFSLYVANKNDICRIIDTRDSTQPPIAKLIKCNIGEDDKLGFTTYINKYQYKILDNYDCWNKDNVKPKLFVNNGKETFLIINKPEQSYKNGKFIGHYYFVNNIGNINNLFEEIESLITFLNIEKYIEANEKQIEEWLKNHI